MSYLYNTEDERVMKISPQGVTRYITDGNGQVLAEYDGYNNLQNNYIYGNGEKLAKINTGGTKEYYHNDYLGSVRRVSTQGRNLTWSRDYYPFGETREASGANEDNIYTYEGKEKDLETDLWNNWNRHFNDKGRFTQVDPLWSKYPSLSPYVRVANNPLRFVDEDGKKIKNPNSFEAQYLKDAMNQTEIGKEYWGKMADPTTRLIDISFSALGPADLVTKKIKLGTTQFGETTTITIFLGNSTANTTFADFGNYLITEYLNMVGVHEATHAVKKDVSIGNENEAMDNTEIAKDQIDEKKDDNDLKIRRIN